MTYQIISMFESDDGNKHANILAKEDSPFKLEMLSTEHPDSKLCKYYTTLQQAEDAAENYVMGA